MTEKAEEIDRPDADDPLDSLEEQLLPGVQRRGEIVSAILLLSRCVLAHAREVRAAAKTAAGHAMLCLDPHPKEPGVLCCEPKGEPHQHKGLKPGDGSCVYWWGTVR